MGKLGYFNQNSDARIAEFDLAQLLYNGEGIPRDLPRAFSLVSNVIDEAHGGSIFFCCEFNGGLYFDPPHVAALKAKIEAAMTPAEREQGLALLDRTRSSPQQVAK